MPEWNYIRLPGAGIEDTSGNSMEYTFERSGSEDNTEPDFCIDRPQQPFRVYQRKQSVMYPNPVTRYRQNKIYPG